MELSTVPIEKPADINFILGQSHFIKTIEDLHEAIVQTVPQMKFGIAFCESSGPALIRWTGNDTELMDSVAGAAPLEDDSGQRRVLSGTARQGGIPGCQEDQVVEVSAGQAKCAAFPGKADPRAAPQFLATFIASGLAGGDEHLQILRGLHDLTGLHLNWMAYAIQSLLSRGQCA